MRLDNDATHLADAQSRRKEAATGEKEVFGDPLLHPPDARPHTSPKLVELANLAFPETGEQLLPGASHDALDMPNATTGFDWDLSPEQQVRRIRALLQVAADGGAYAHVAVMAVPARMATS